MSYLFKTVCRTTARMQEVERRRKPKPRDAASERIGIYLQRVLNRQLVSSYLTIRQNNIVRSFINLVSIEVQINDLNESIRFDRGDDILTEISQKYTYTGIEKMLTEVNFSITDHYEDDNAYFSLVLASK